MPRPLPLPPVVGTSLEKKAIYNLTGGFNDNTNQNALSDEEISDGLNVILGDDQLWTGRGGNHTVGNYLGATTKIQGLHEYFRPSTGARTIIAAYNTKLFTLSSGEWADAGVTLTTGHDVQFTNGNDCAYYTNGVDTFGKLSNTTWSTLANFPVSGGGATNQPHGIDFWKERIICWNTDAFPNRVYYSNAEAETTSATNYFDLPEPVIGGAAVGDAFYLLFTENQIYRVDNFIFTGAQFDPNDVQPLLPEKGAVSQRGIIRAGNLIYFPARDGFYVTDGSIVKSISDGRIENFFASLSQTYLSRAAAGLDGTRIRWAVSVSGTNNDREIMYDYIKGIWYPPSDNCSFSCYIPTIASSAPALYAGEDQAIGTVYQLNQTTPYDEKVEQQYVAGQDADEECAGATATRVAQSFQVTEDLELTSVALYLKKASGTTTELTVRIETDSSGVPSGTLVTNGSSTIAAFSATSYAWKEASFSTSPMLMAGTTYWLVLHHTTEGSGNSVYNWGSDGSSPTYTSGNAANYASSTWTADANTDCLFRIYHKDAYDKYIVTKGFYLSDPQLRKRIKRLYIEAESLGAWFLNVGIGADGYDSYSEYSVDLTANAPIRGSVTRGQFVRGTQEGVRKFLRTSGLKARMLRIRYRNPNHSENFKVIGTEVNYQTIKTLR